MNNPGAFQPPVLRQFRHVNRYWDDVRQQWVAKILPGQYYVCTNHSELIATTLGSCISACIRDSKLGIGGMNHFMLPIQQHQQYGWLDAATRYGSYAMEYLINELLKQGAARDRLEVKLAGGGRLLTNMTDIGLRNIEFVTRYLSVEGIKITAQDTGDVFPRKVLYDPVSGMMRTKKLRSFHNDTLLTREAAYQQSLMRQPVSGGVELF
ncbi:chemoreceptor glutamine deamidase CheD [Methylophaga lonarensis MPL]|uniref:Probable chemoreceptor glutamine deamidase CheD n=1 Tax=Methylophaga lonarensis MPL TaxID=1286106 RepID=M7PH84_9GAMM|nr:chemoreceptor glutamine deamidase CheD [Methylophaga lonarensis]EMR13250.1 chemoreceptor glutamine deamidase CheD [Methylophaga lonarensis MPL]